MQAEPQVSEAPNNPVVEIKQDQSLQTIEGFGSCFNELGWTSLNSLKPEVWRWQKRLETLPLFLATDETLPGQWRFCVSLLEYVAGGWRYQPWGWHQNSLVSVDTLNKTYKFNHEYYLMKHFSHYIKPGAKRLATTGTFDNLLAFKNPNGDIVVVAQNDDKEGQQIGIKVGEVILSAVMKADSFNTWLISL